MIIFFFTLNMKKTANTPIATHTHTFFSTSNRCLYVSRCNRFLLLLSCAVCNFSFAFIWLFFLCRFHLTANWIYFSCFFFLLPLFLLFLFHIQIRFVDMCMCFTEFLPLFQIIWSKNHFGFCFDSIQCVSIVLNKWRIC